MALHLNLEENSESVALLKSELYVDFNKAIDGVDDGNSQYQTVGRTNYQNRSHITTRMSDLNPQWNEDLTEEQRMERFEKASTMVGSECSSQAKNLLTGIQSSSQLTIFLLSPETGSSRESIIISNIGFQAEKK